MLVLFISAACSIGLLVHFIIIKGLRDPPGDILLMVSLGDLVSTLNQILMNFYCLGQEDPEVCDHNVFYTMSNYTDVIANNIVNFYYMSFCLYHVFPIKSALKGPGIPSCIYHAGPWIMAILCTYGSYKLKGFESEWISLFGFGLTAEMILSLFKYSALTYMTIVLAKQIKAYLPQYTKISEARHEFLDYSGKYLVILRYVYIAKGLIEFITSMVINEGLNENTSRVLNLTMLAGHLLSGTFPIILTLARFNDPLIKKYWNGLVHRGHGNDCKKKIEKASKLELTSKLLEKSLKIKPQLQQIRYCRKVQVVYSILSGIHYFWHVREAGKLNGYSKKRRISVLSEIKDSEHRQEKYKVKHVIKVKNNELKKEVPQIYNEVKSRGYHLAQGKLTSYAQEAFSEIIKLDHAENEIIKSLDLKENLSRICNSGLNQAGKSGEFFFFSKDNKFVIKTICLREVKALLKILPKYTQHFKENPNSLIVKIYGLFAFKIEYSYEKYHFILMRNLNDCCLNNTITRKYDLKGSTVGRRTVKKSEIELEDLYKYDTLKDLDFNKYENKLVLDPKFKFKLFDVLEKDVEFLSSQGLIDYSLILQVMVKNKGTLPELSVETLESSDSTCASEANLPEENPQFNLFESADGTLVYKLGIIDYLTEFGFRKKLEIFFKKLIAMDPNYNISAQRPKFYGERFVKYFISLVE